MDQFVKFLDVTIWPCVVLITIFKLREPLKSLLPLIENLKYKGIEVKFRKKLNQIKEESKETGIEITKEIDNKTEIYKLVEISPALAIMESWKEIEIEAGKKVKALAPANPKFKNINHRPVAYLEYTGALIPSTARTIRELQLLRNKAAHSHDLNITKDDALEYVSLAQAILKQIESITELPKIKLTALTRVIGELTPLLDSGKYNHITIEDVHREIKRKNIIPFLAEITKGDSDFSVYSENGPYENFVDYYHEKMLQIYEGYAGDERRKWGIEKLGLALLLTWTNTIIQQGAGWHPDDY